MLIWLNEMLSIHVTSLITSSVELLHIEAGNTMYWYLLRWNTIRPWNISVNTNDVVVACVNCVLSPGDFRSTLAIFLPRDTFLDWLMFQSTQIYLVTYKQITKLITFTLTNYLDVFGCHRIIPIQTRPSHGRQAFLVIKCSRCSFL